MNTKLTLGKAIGRAVARVASNSSVEGYGETSEIRALFLGAICYAEDLNRHDIAQHIVALRKQFQAQFGIVDSSDSHLPDHVDLPLYLKIAIEQEEDVRFDYDNPEELRQRIRLIIGPSFGGIIEDKCEFGGTCDPEELKASFCKESQMLLGLV